MSLRTSLNRMGLPIDEYDIWQDARAAKFVQRANGGNETVPTLRIGTVTLTNPTTREVLAAIQEHAPEILPPDWEPPAPGRLRRMFDRALGG